MSLDVNADIQKAIKDSYSVGGNMGLKKSWKYGWVWDDETTTPYTTWASTTTTGEPIEIKAPSWQHEQPIVINSPTWKYKPAIPQGWECPKCGRVNSPTVGTCPCYLTK